MPSTCIPSFDQASKDIKKTKRPNNKLKVVIQERKIADIKIPLRSADTFKTKLQLLNCQQDCSQQAARTFNFTPLIPSNTPTVLPFLNQLYQESLCLQDFMPQDFTIVDDFVVVSNLVKANDKKFLRMQGISHIINTVNQHTYSQSSGSDSETVHKCDSVTLSDKSLEQANSCEKTDTQSLDTVKTSSTSVNKDRSGNYKSNVSQPIKHLKMSLNDDIDQDLTEAIYRSMDFIEEALLGS